VVTAPPLVVMRAVFFGIVLALGTSVCWALGNVFIQRSGRALGGPRALTWALALGGVASAVAAALFDQRSESTAAGTWGWLLVAAIAGLFAYAGLFYAFSRAKLSLAVPFVSSWSVVAGAMSLTVFHQSAGAAKLGGALIVLAGVVLVSLGAARAPAAPGEGGTNDGGGWLPLGAAFLSGLGFGVMVPTMAHLTPALGLFGTAAAVYLIGLALAVPIALSRGISLAWPTPGTWREVIGAGLFETLGFVALNAAGRFAPVAVVAPVASLAAVLTVVYAAIFLRERPGPLALSGAFLASLGVVVLAL
jgi:drug/metabolite transporter (DMT)-like permease